MKVNEDRVVRICLIVSVLMLVGLVVGITVVAVIGLWAGGGIGALVGGAVLLWLFVLLVRRVERYVAGKGWL